MSERMVKYFENILSEQMHTIQEKEAEIVSHVAEISVKESDIVDQGILFIILMRSIYCKK
jgi:hypothetical protein